MLEHKKELIEKVLFFFFGLVLITLSQRVYFADSELWSVANAAASTSFNIYDSYKMLFNIFLKKSSILFSESLFLIKNFRFLFAILALGTVFLTSRILNKFYKVPVVISLGLFGINSFFLLRSFRIRADNISIFIVLGAFYFYKSIKNKKNYFWIILALIEVVTFLVTIKSIIPLLILNLFIYWDLEPTKRKSLFIKWNMQFIIGLLLSVVVYLLQPELVNNLVRYLLFSIEGGLGMPSYFSWVSFLHIFSFVRENLIFVLLNFVSIIFFIKEKNYSILALGLGTITAVVLFPERYPFFIASLMPFLVIVSAIFLQKFYEFFKKYRVYLLLFTLVKFFMPVFFILKVHSNKQQIDAINQVSEYMEKIGYPPFYDSVGILPNKAPILAFMGPNNNEGNEYSYRKIRSSNPEVVLCANKCLFSQDLLTFLGEYYLNLGNGVFIKASTIGLGNSLRVQVDGNTLVEVSMEYLEKILKAAGYKHEALYFYSLNSSEPLVSFFLKNVNGEYVTVKSSVLRLNGKLAGNKSILFKPENLPIKISVYPPLSFESKESLIDIFSFDF